VRTSRFLPVWTLARRVGSYQFERLGRWLAEVLGLISGAYLLYPTLRRALPVDQRTNLFFPSF